MLGTDLARALPWYFGAAIGAGWIILVVAIAALGRHTLRARAERRRDYRATAVRRTVPDERAIGPGTDLEPW